MNTTTNTRGVSEAMVERACEASWPIAKFSCELSDWKQIGSGPRREHHTNVVRAALEAALSAQPAERVPEGEVKLWDTQWLNIVNHDNCYRDWDKADTINHAVKMTEQAIARNVADGKLPKTRAASPAPSPARGDGGDG